MAEFTPAVVSHLTGIPADEIVSLARVCDYPAAALALGLMHVIIREKLHDAEYVSDSRSK